MDDGSLDLTSASIVLRGDAPLPGKWNCRRAWNGPAALMRTRSGSTGHGGFYDDLGCVGRQPHLLPVDRDSAWAADPGFVSTSQSEFGNRVDRSTMTLNRNRLSWCNQAETLFGTPLRMRYTDLDPDASYRLRVSYAGRFRATMRLMADQAHEIHGRMPQPSSPWPIEFDVPTAATRDGVLELQWELIEQRGCQVAEVWLIKQSGEGDR